MASWLIQKEAKAERFWKRLATRPPSEQDAFNQAEQSLADEPRLRYYPPGTIKHLKGQFHCNHEYRTLPNAQRIYYKIWTRAEIEKAVQEKRANTPLVEHWEEDSLGIVIIFYAGPHPS